MAVPPEDRIFSLENGWLKLWKGSVLETLAVQIAVEIVDSSVNLRCADV